MNCLKPLFALAWGLSSALACSPTANDLEQLNDKSPTKGEDNAANESSSGGSNSSQSNSSGDDSEQEQTPNSEEPLLIEEGAYGFCGLAGVIETIHQGYSGSGYANADNLAGRGIEWSLQSDSDDSAQLSFRFANGASLRSAVLMINDTALAESLEFAPTGAWTTWEQLEVGVQLQAGKNTIKLLSSGADGLANIDSLQVTSSGVSVESCESSETSTGAGSELGDTTIYIAGDSTVSTYADTADPGDQAGWGQMLHELFDERVTVINRAAGGRTARWFALEGGTEWIFNNIKAGEYFFIQFGTNDSHPSAEFTVNGVTYPRFADANTTFKQHLLEYYIEPSRDRSVVPVLVTPPPRNSAYCAVGNSLGGYANAMRTLAEEENVLLLDLNQRTYDHLAAICPSPNPEDFFFLRSNGSVDGTHFQENGARHMASFLGDEMTSKQVGPYQYLLP